MTSEILFVETNKILTSTFRVERNIAEDGVLLELKNNIKNYGIKVPLIVTLTKENSYKLIDGHRRLQVAISLEMETVPCIIENSDNVMEIALSVNIHREDFTSIEVGNLLLDIYTQQKGKNPSFTYSKLAEIVNKSKGYISQHIGYVTLLDMTVQKDILDNKRFIDKNILNRISKLDTETQLIVYKELLENKLNREDVQKLIIELTKNDSITKINENIDDEESENDNSILNVEENIDDEESEKDNIFISNANVEFKLKSSLLSKNIEEEFKQEFFLLLTKYKLYVEV